MPLRIVVDWIVVLGRVTPLVQSLQTLLVSRPHAWVLILQVLSVMVGEVLLHQLLYHSLVRGLLVFLALHLLHRV